MLRLFTICSFLVYGAISVAQEETGLVMSGSIQSDVLLPAEDEEIGTLANKEWGLTNTYADVSLQSKYIDAGAKVEFLRFPLPGYEKDFKGWGLANLYVKGRIGKLELTAGSLYDQFGSGFIFRTYEERSLGIDNSIYKSYRSRMD